MKKLFRFFKRLFIGLLILLVIAGIVIFFYMRQPQFGALPEGWRLELVKKSPHYKDGRFRNLVERPTITPGYSIWKEGYKAIFKKFPRTNPDSTLPSIKTDLKKLPADSNVLIWFGHSSFYMQVDGIKFLVDPVFSGKASPLPWGVKAFKGSDIYTTEDMPEIDYMLLSHDHYDHLDYETAKGLRSKVKKVICGLGAGAHYERWGYDTSQIIEKDWYQQVEIKPGFVIHTESSHHDAGRGFTRGQALWLSFLIQSPSLTVYYSGDGGRDDRFKRIGEKYPNIDWAIMECGQYNVAWQSVHELPEEVIASTNELHAKNLFIVHHSKFILAQHPWDEPLEKISSLSASQAYRFVTPMIGEQLSLTDTTQLFKQWWKGM